MLCWLFLAVSSAALAELAIVQPVVAQYDGGPSVASGFGFRSGESIFLSFDISGFKPEGDEDLKLKLSWTCQAYDAAGVPLVEMQKGDVNVDLAPEDKKWRPKVRVELPIPEAVPTGTAEIRLTAADRVAGTKATLTIPFQTRGLTLPPGDKLQQLRFRFLRTEDSNEALSVAAYRAGDSVWARFEMAGYKLGDGNTYEVGYGIEVFRPNGESLFRQEEAANEKGKSFYPRRYLPGAMSIQMSKDISPGEYTIVLRIRDGIGKQESESKHTFRVE
ncbi:MAG: hypothetical protein HYX27_05335 [Acidobacteria bacterium]|nr:hypothetical protein [Acidobacteriota bacterium]